MNFYLYKLNFTSPVHFGTSESALSLYTSSDHFLADTLFSALCHEAKSLYGEDGINCLAQAVSNANLLLTDSMVWCGDDYYLPKPYYVGERSEDTVSSTERKKLKKLSWIPINAFDSFQSSTKGQQKFSVEAVRSVFGEEDEATRVHLTDVDQSLPYQVGTFSFYDDCGLYFIAGINDNSLENSFPVLVNALALDGIGGKTSSGYGKFLVEDVVLLNEPFDEQTDWLFTRLTSNDAKNHLLLTTSLPNDDEMESAVQDASYQLTRRGGFIFSETYSPSLRKKDTEYFFSSGSVLSNPFSGSLRIVGSDGAHPVYRYSKPVFLGVSL